MKKEKKKEETTTKTQCVEKRSKARENDVENNDKNGKEKNVFDEKSGMASASTCEPVK